MTLSKEFRRQKFAREILQDCQLALIISMKVWTLELTNIITLSKVVALTSCWKQCSGNAKDDLYKIYTS